MPQVPPGLTHRISGNTAGTTLNIFQGSYVLAGGANVTLSQDGSTVSIVGGAGGTGGGGGTGNLGGLAAGTQTATSGTVLFSNSNGISFGMSGSSRITASYTVPTQTTQPGIQSLSAGTTRATTGEVVFSNSNGLAFGLSGQTLTGSYTTPVQTTQPGLQSLSAGTTRATTGEVVFSNSNGIAFGLAGQTVTASYTVPTQSVQPGLQSISAGATRVTTGEVVFSNSNGLAFGLAGQTMTGSYTVPTQSTQPAIQALSAAGGAVTTGTVVFSNSNGLAFGLAGSTITGSYTVPTVPAQFSGGLSNIGNTSGNTGLVTARLVLAGGNNITLSGSTNAGSMTISISGGAAGGADGFNILAAGSQTAGTATTVVFSSANGISFGMAGSSVITAFYTVPTVTNSSWTVSDAATSGSVGRLAFTNLNGLTLSLSSGTGGLHTIVGSHNALTAISSQSLGLNTSTAGGGTGGTSGLASGAQVRYDFYAGSNITLSQSLNGASGSLSIYGTSGGGGGGTTLSSYEPYLIHNTGTTGVSLQHNTSASMSLFPFEVRVPVAAEYVKLAMSLSFVSTGSPIRQTDSFQWGLFTRPTGTNSSRLSGTNTGSFSIGLSWDGTQMTVSQPTSTNSTGYNTASITSIDLNLTSLYTGLKMVGLYLGSTMTPGQYWLGLHHRNSFSTAGVSLAGFRWSLYGDAYSLTAFAPIGSNPSSFTVGTDGVRQIGGNWLLGHASYVNGAMTALTTDVSMSQMSQNLGIIPYMRFETRV